MNDIDVRVSNLTLKIELSNLDSHKKASLKSLLIAAKEMQNTNSVYALYLINQVSQRI